MGAARVPGNRRADPVCPSRSTGLNRLYPPHTCVNVSRVGSGGLLSAILSEQPDDVLADLKRQLEKRIAEARGALAQSESELSLVQQAIDARGRRGSGETEGPAGGVDDERDREPDGRFQGIPRARILAVASTVHYPITPARVVEAFAERGESVNIEQIRIALNRIAKDGNLTKVGPSLFAVPGRQSTELDPSQQQPVSQTGIAPDPFRRGVLGTGISRNTFRPDS